MKIITRHLMLIVSIILLINLQSYAQELSFTLKYPAQLLQPYPIVENNSSVYVPHGTFITAFSLNKKAKTLYIYNDSLMGQIIVDDNDFKLAKKANIPDLVNKNPLLLESKCKEIRMNIDSFIFKKDSIAKRRIFIQDSIAKRKIYIKDSIAKRNIFVQDSISKQEALKQDSLQRTKGYVLDGTYKFPFSFSLILGKTKNNGKISKTTIFPRYSDTVFDKYDTLGNGRNIIIGRVFKKNYNINDNGSPFFYLAYYLNREFYIDSNDVILTKETKAQLDSLMLCTQEVKDSFNIKAKYQAILMDIATIDAGIKILKSYKRFPISIKSWSIFDSSEYTDGTGAEFTFYNPTKKTIKYIYPTVIGYNAVDDKIGSKTLTCIGPIEPEGFCSYTFDYVWMTDLVKNAKISNLKIQYKDGTTRTITRPSQVVWTEEEINSVENLVRDEKTLEEYQKIVIYDPFEKYKRDLLERPEIEEHPDIKPSFPGGDEALKRMISWNLRHPEHGAINGTVVLCLIINENGAIADIKIEKSLNHVCDKEAINAIKRLPHFTAAKKDGKYVKSKYICSVEFTND